MSEATARKLDEDVAKDLQDRILAHERELEQIREVLTEAGYKLTPKKEKVGVIAATWGSPNKAVRITTRVVMVLAAGGLTYGGYRGVKAYRAKKAAAAQPQVTTL